MSTYTFDAMGTKISLRIIPSGPTTEEEMTQTYEQAKSNLQRLEGLLTRFNSKSDISLINQNEGKWTYVHYETVEMLKLAQQAMVDSNGYYHPGLGSVIEGFGYDASFDTITERKQLNEACVTYESSAVTFDHTVVPFEISEKEKFVRLKKGSKIMVDRESNLPSLDGSLYGESFHFRYYLMYGCPS